MKNVALHRIARTACIAAFAFGLLLSPAAHASVDPACPAAPILPAIELPHLRSAVSHGIEGVVVSLGSSSTQGAMASDLAHSYPALLQQLLSAGLPQAHIAVLNRGIGGQDATE